MHKRMYTLKRFPSNSLVADIFLSIIFSKDCKISSSMTRLTSTLVPRTSNCRKKGGTFPEHK